MSRRPLLKNLDFSQVSTRKCQQQGSDSTMDIAKSGGYTWPAVNSVPQLDIIRSQSSGILKISPEKTFEFTADDLEDLGEIGQGSFGVVYKMRHQISNTVMAVKTVKALSYLKDKLHIIHRDVKPSNILLDRSGRIKLCDFGIAGKLVDSIARTRDAGCKPYMAPERIDPCKSRRGYDVRADVWSLGITLVEIATGQFPYPPWNSVFDQLQQVVDGDPPLLSPKDYPFFSMDFIYFVNCCLMKDEEQRPKYKQLLETKFITKYEREAVDVGAYVCSVFDSNASMSNE
ncbi:hypothetical protein D917_00077 [Trichinella nativa]|uniref:mitogen-activated protein kinase kinase n=1 Tax=Trichinella nativa TaxID=6335 RepID=A0A1Y3EZM3_9BILA|nr:hypothetical protein D917_00077 [Trichinella nativa]